MTANDWQEWRKNKLQQQEVAKWTSRFQSATGNQEEWQKVFRAYLQSAVWREKRRQVLIRANSKCERCGSIILDPDVHHITYDHVGDERLDELIVLCFPCHRIADAGRDNDTEERRIDAYYEARLNGFAARKYGNGWKFEYEREDVEIKFIMYLYKLYCEEYDLDLAVCQELCKNWRGSETLSGMLILKWIRKFRHENGHNKGVLSGENHAQRKKNLSQSQGANRIGSAA